jgi:surface antigen/LysM repeat protein
VLPCLKTNSGYHGGSDLAQSRFLTHTLVLLAAALIPVLTAFDRLHTDTVYGANPSPFVSLRATHVDDVVLAQGGFIMKVNASSVDTPTRRDVVYYTVKPGDTVQNVAGRYGLTIDTLRWANNIADVSAVVQGQRLLIPPVNGILVKVQPTTQLDALAIQYHVNLQDIIDFNLLRDPTTLKAGAMLMLPDGVGPALDPPGVGKKVVRGVTWNRLGRQVTNYTIVYSTAPVYGAGGKFPYGYCTWWVAHKRFIPWSGNAWQWWYNAQQFGYAEGQVPKVGAIMVQGISWTSPVGHVSYVESVWGDGSFTVSEMNYGGWGRVDYRTIKSTAGLDLLGFIY